MNNPFKNNSLASFLLGILMGGGGAAGYYAVTEPDPVAIQQPMMSGFMDTNAGGNQNKETQTPTQQTPATQQYPQNEKFHGLENNANGDVFITKSGAKYHRRGCNSINGREYIQVNKTDAEAKGLSACARCKP